MHTELFKMKHLDMIDPLGGDQILQQVKAPFSEVDTSGNILAMTLLDGDKVISICGVYKIWDGVGEAFTIMCKDIRKYGRALYTTYLLNLPIIFKSLELWRIQATVIVDFKDGIKFMEGLKFKREGMMEKWTPEGRDVYMYAMVKED